MSCLLEIIIKYCSIASIVALTNLSPREDRFLIYVNRSIIFLMDCFSTFVRYY